MSRRGDRIVRALGPGDHFGEKAILEDGVRTATVTADTTVAVLVMIGYHFRELEAHYPEIGAAIHAESQLTGADDRRPGCLTALFVPRRGHPGRTARCVSEWRALQGFG